MANTIKLYSISELLERKFYVPSYQRGYRWTRQQVEDLLDDLYTFAKKKKNDNEFYCLQPVVVKEHTWHKTTDAGNQEVANGWELVDGQQRLTTIRILLSYLIKEHLRDGETLSDAYGKDIYTIEYETRPGTEGFLNNLDESNDENIDFYHISSAYRYIKEWFEKSERPKPLRENLIRTLVYDMENKEAEGVVQVIWYQIEDKAIETFIRINLGKISLTNSELIKALFVQERNFGIDNEISKLRQLEIASEWDRIENGLQDSDFWWFLNKGENNKPARIEFIFDVIRSVAICNDPENQHRKTLKDIEVEERKKSNPSIEERIGTDRFATFRYFYQKFDNDSDYSFLKTEWEIVTDYYNTFQEWYSHPVWYHYIGFLIYCGEDLVKLFDLTKSPNLTKDEITAALRKKIADRFDKIKWIEESEEEPFLDLSYPKNNQKIRELLLLFNLESIVRQCELGTLIYKFPFKTFKEENWDVEHIDSYTENTLKDRPTQIEWLKIAKADFQDLQRSGDLYDKIKAFIADENSTETFESIYTDIVKLAGDETNDEKTKNNIGNLTLLDSETNRSYGNALFSTKRRIIIQKDTTGTFIPIGTKNLFLKYFDQKASSLNKWTETDIKTYRNMIAETLTDFLPKKPKITRVNE